MATPYVTIVRNVVGSTQDLASSELRSSDRPILVVAARQTSGRGRSGNEWWQAPRAVAASLAFDVGTFPVEETFSLSVGLAVRSAIWRAVDVAVDLKWPNDLERVGRKIGGILVERNGERVVVGCGLNLYWPDAPPATGGVVDQEPGADLGLEISELWAAAVLDSAGVWDQAAYIEACSTIGAEVTWQPAGAGMVATVDQRGGLVVDTDDGRVTLRSGEVRQVRRGRTSDDV